MVCILPDIENIHDEKRKELVQNKLNSSLEEEAKKFFQISYREFKNINDYIKPWAGKEIYFDSSLGFSFTEAKSRCPAMGGQLPSVHTQEGMNTLSALVNGETIYLGASPVDTRGKGSSPYSCSGSCCLVTLFSSSSTGFLNNWTCAKKYKFACIILGTVSLSVFENKIRMDKMMMKQKEMNSSLFHFIKSMENRTLISIESEKRILNRLNTLETEMTLILFFLCPLFVIIVLLTVLLSLHFRQIKFRSHNSSHLDVLYECNDNDGSLEISRSGKCT